MGTTQQHVNNFFGVGIKTKLDKTQPKLNFSSNVKPKDGGHDEPKNEHEEYADVAMKDAPPNNSSTRILDHVSKSGVKRRKIVDSDGEEAAEEVKSFNDSESDQEYKQVASEEGLNDGISELVDTVATNAVKPDREPDAKPKILLQPGESYPYSELAETFDKIESTSSRLQIINYCAEFYLNVLQADPLELSTIVYLCINRLGPDYEGLELGLGETLIIKALAEATGRSLAQIKNDYRQTGDLGLVALNSRKSQPTMFAPKRLTVKVVFESLQEIAHSTGASSQNKKIGVIKRLLTACKGNEAKYLVRSLEGKLRIGLAEKSVLTSLAQAFLLYERGDNKTKQNPAEISKAEDLMRDVYCQLPNYGLIIEAATKDGIMNIAQTCKLTAGIPLKPMLAKPSKSITEILDRFHGEEFTCEYKYDGERAQVHLTEEGKLHVYSRNSEDMSQRYPDILSSSSKFVGPDTKSFILDCEAVAWDRDLHKILPFQVLSTRKRKDVEEGDIKVRVCLFAFDILYLNGEILLQKPLVERRELIRQHFNVIEGEFSFAKSMDSNDIEDIQAFLDQSVKDSCEGLMIKAVKGIDSQYEPSKRSRNWLKLKKDYLSGVGDSLDLVVLGAYYGRGRRTKVYGAFLLGCYNADLEVYETVCKIGTGFSDEMLETLYQKLEPTEVSKPKSYITYENSPNALPDVWFDPSMVWEVLTADLSLSPIYKAGISDLGKGVSLRFPRFVRIREDKGIEDATTSEQIVSFYQRQVSVQ